MIIDSHIHIGKPDFISIDNFEFEYDLFCDYEEVIHLLDENDIAKAVVFPVPHHQIDTIKSNDYVLEAYQKYPDRIIPFCRIDEKLEENICQNGFRGVKLHLVYENLEIKKLKKEFQIIEDSGVPLVVHAKYANKVKQIESILKYAPNINIILAHMGRGHIYTGEQVVENAVGLKNYENVYFDLSTIGDVRAIISCCDIVGYNRVLYASDYPFGKSFKNTEYSYSSELKGIKDSIPPEWSDYIFCKNIEKILRLSDKESLLVRRAKKRDYDDIVSLFERIDDTDKKYLALKNKYSLIKQVIKSERHCYVATINNSIVGFMRESGRPENYSLLEEILVDPNCRGQGIASRMLKYYHNAFVKTLATTNAENKGMISLLARSGYVPNNPNAPRIIHWKRN